MSNQRYKIKIIDSYISFQKFVLQFEVSISGGFLDPELEFPITIGTVPLHSAYATRPDLTGEVITEQPGMYLNLSV